MNFGQSVEALKLGSKVAREGWNGKGMFLFMIERWSEVGADGFYPTMDILERCAPFIAMKTADDKVVPWLASQTDVLAEDWTIVL